MPANIKFIKAIRPLVLSAALMAIVIFGGGLAKAEALTSIQKTEIGDVIKEYLMENPQVVIQALEEYQRREEEMQAKVAKEKIAMIGGKLGTSGDPVIGAKDGDVMIVEFFDYNCGYCKHAFTDLMKLIDSDKKIKVVFKELPILSESSKQAARYAIAANKQGKYLEFHTALMKMQGEKNEGAFERLAKEIGLDFAKMKKDAADPAVDKALADNLDLATQLGIRGTPGFIIGDKIYPGYVELKNLEKAVEAVRAEKRG